VGILKAPAGADKARRQVSPDAEPVLGWRPAIGQLVPNTKWMLESKLGEGGFGEVWLGRHQTMKERRVFKFCFRADRVRSLKREMTLFRLIKERIGDHPNIVSLREVYFDQPPFYVEMDYVEGLDLRNWSQEQGGLDKVPLGVKLEIAAQVADGLEAAHQAGVIHRDVKPGNILIAECRLSNADCGSAQSQIANRESQIQVKLTDFGIGQVVSQEHLADVTRAGFTMTLLGSQSSSQTGTHLYMAPELLAGKPATTRSDIYSLGVVLYQMLVGDFSKPLTIDWAGKIHEPLLREDLARCFAGEVGDRFGSAGELARNLRKFSDRQTDRERQEAERTARERAAYRRGMMRVAGLAAAVIVLIAGLALIALSQSRQAARNAESLRHHLYGSYMAVAWNALEDGNVDRTRELLDKASKNLLPGDDLKGFEWRYLWGRSRPRELFTLPVMGDLMVRFSPSGEMVATSGFENGQGIVHLWDALTHKEMIRPITAYSNAIAWTMAFSPDGKMLATGDREGELVFKIWDTVTGALIAALPGTNQDCLGVAFSPDGKRLATLSSTFYSKTNSPVVRIWDLSTRQPLMSMPDLKRWALHAEFSPDGRFLALGDGAGLVRLWDLETQATRILTGHHGFVSGVKFSPNGKALATADQNGTIIVWDWRSGAVLRVLIGHRQPVPDLAISRDSRLIASGSYDHAARLWNLETGDDLARFLGHTDRVWGLDFSPDGRTLATAGGDGVRFWSTVPNPEGEILVLTHSGGGIVGYSPDNRFVFLEDPDIHEISLISTATKAVAHRLTGHNLAFSPDGRICTLIQAHTNLVIYDASTMKSNATYSSHQPLDGPATIAAGGEWLAMRQNRKPVIIDLSKKSELVTLPSDAGQFVFTPDAKGLLVQENGGIRLWETRTWRPLRWICTTNKEAQNYTEVQHFALSGDGKTLATSSGETVWLWNLSSPSSPASLVLGSAVSDIYSLAISADGKNVAAGNYDGPITLWNIPGRQEIGTFRLHRSIVWSVAFSPDGRSLASGSYDSTVRLWAAPSVP
jgi:WD40 repeat protein/serine/threonine protein kinase